MIALFSPKLRHPLFFFLLRYVFKKFSRDLPIIWHSLVPIMQEQRVYNWWCNKSRPKIDSCSCRKTFKLAIRLRTSEPSKSPRWVFLFCCCCCPSKLKLFFPVLSWASFRYGEVFFTNFLTNVFSNVLAKFLTNFWRIS